MEIGVEGPPGRGRRVAAWMILVLGSVLGGALVAPFLHRGLVALGRSHEALSGLRDLPFERLLSRCVLLLLIVGLVPALRWGGVRRFEDLGLGSLRTGLRDLICYFGVGGLMIAAVLAAGWWVGAYRPSADGWLVSSVAFLPAALLVGVVEETLFRGVIFRSLCGPGRLWGAVVISSLLFSAVHFAAPEPTLGVAHAHWYSGLQLIPDMFRKVHATYHYFPFMLNLFLMGIALCLVVHRTGTLYAAIGLHAGWVWAMRVGNLLLHRETARWPAVFGWDNRLAVGYAATLLMVVMVLGLLLWPSSRSRGNA